ncbi:response regulator [Paenibacillus sp. YN15]|uniref:response regulator transcription factor n=1 Tax=Paenibacillus sp. YN15 TaxID=1742774 RepID=UPI000DCB3D96|nr:response regulator [Paenibacillus sp. YN15]RAV01451.1 hypothetical protein DQG13_12155 [Paenibacillus sp. YN15]
MQRVLVVDDSHLIRSSIAKSVERFSDTVVVSGTAGNGQEALEWLERHYADLCITDVRMPVMDGLALISELGRRYPWMLSIVVSSYDEFDYAKMSIELEAIDYILKPVDQTKLNKALEKSVAKLQAGRLQQAGELFIRKLPHHRMVMNKWLEHIQTLRTETMPLLIVDTLELLKDWVGEKYYLLNALSMCWLQTVVEELHDSKLAIELEEGTDLGLGDKRIETANIRFYFRLCAVRRLEEGAHRLVESMIAAKEGQSPKVIEDIKKHIAGRLAEKPSLQELADQAGISRSHLANIFKQQTGTTVNQYIIAERMRAARDMLLHTAMKSYEIADRVGYEDVIYFSQLFKKHYGLAPMEYKKRMES